MLSPPRKEAIANGHEYQGKSDEKNENFNHKCDGGLSNSGYIHVVYVLRKSTGATFSLYTGPVNQLPRLIRFHLISLSVYHTSLHVDYIFNVTVEFRFAFLFD